MTTLSVEEVRAIRERAAKATPGPWNVYGSTCVETLSGGHVTGMCRSEEDARFILGARADVPALCDTIDGLRDERDIIHASIADLQARCAKAEAVLADDRVRAALHALGIEASW